MADQDSRRAARLATLVALPVALLAGVLAFVLLNARGDGGAEPSPGPSSPRAQETEPVTMAAPHLDDRTAVICRALLAALPDRIRDLPRRPVTAGPEQNAAYGDPAIQLACGGARPAVAPTDFLLVMDGVCWRSSQSPDHTAWTTADRAVPVRVTVPADYAQPAQWVNEFSAAVVTAVPSASAAPSGCR
ncbi:MAG TPA: DUF3515 domain-containing protein [Micromonosporaceae bacterium]